MENRVNKEITKKHLRELCKLVMGRIESQRRGHTLEQKKGYDLREPFAVALCQGAAMHYLGRRSDKNKPKGVKDFDIWLLYEKNDVRFRFNRCRLVDQYHSNEFGERAVDILMRAIDYQDSPKSPIQEWLATSKNSSPQFLSKKAVILIYPKIKPIWCEGKPY